MHPQGSGSSTRGSAENTRPRGPGTLRPRAWAAPGLWPAACQAGALAGLALALAAGCSSGALGSREDAGASASDAPPGAADGAGGSPDAGAVPGLDAGTAPPACGCFDGPGDYCERAVATYAASEGCVALDARADGEGLFSCADEGTWTRTATCAAGCEGGETGASAACALPACDCFIRASWCGASAARHALTLEPPCRIPLAEEHAEDILGCDASGRFVVLERCEAGCAEMPTGTPDACVATRTPVDPGWAECPHRALLRSGLHPEASDRLRCAGVAADRISQTVGYATASAGYHAPDGTAGGMPYTAAVDLRTRDLTTSEIRALLDRLGRNGFAAWYRQPGADGWPASEAPHIHAIFAGVVMKSSLRSQVRDFLDGRNGLTSHSIYRFWVAPSAVRDVVRLLFSRHYTP